MRQILTALRYKITGKALEGYENPEVVETVFRKTVAYRPSESLDIFGARTVLDFGGGCGRHYKQAQSPSVRWAVVETPAMVARASEFETDRLKFFTSIRAAKEWLGEVDVMHSNGALQFAPDPIATLKELCALGARTMLWERLVLSDRIETKTQISRLIDNGPGKISGVANKVVAYAATSIPESVFLACHQGYRLEDRAHGAFWFVK